MTRADRLRDLVLSTVILFGALASTGAWASEEAPIATAQGKSAAPSLDAVAAPSSTATQIKQWLADTSSDEGGPPGPLPDRKIHGEFDAWVGNQGTRGFAAQAVIPLGTQTTVGIAVSRSSGRGVYGDWGGPGGFVDPRFVEGCGRAEVPSFGNALRQAADQACTDADTDRFNPNR